MAGARRCGELTRFPHVTPPIARVLAGTCGVFLRIGFLHARGAHPSKIRICPTSGFVVLVGV